jgi:hypothetical protein
LQEWKKQGSRWAALPEFRWLALASLLAVSLSYLVRPTMVIEPGSGLLGAVSVRNFHDAEGAYRWTRGRSSLVFPDPGPGLDLRVEARISGFRPPGQDPPVLVIQSEGASVRARPARRPDTVSFETVTRGWWRSDLEILFRSETFTPGEADRRALGVRVHKVKLVPEGAFIQPGWAPLRQLVLTTLGLLLLFVLLVRSGRSPRRAFYVGLGAATLWALGFAFARAHAALLSPVAFWALALAAAFPLLFPGTAQAFREALAEALRSGTRGLRLLVGRQAAALTVLGVIGVTASYLAQPSLEIDLGSGRETTLVDRFAGLDQEEGVKFRRALRGAAIDLRDFGGGGEWTIDITASLADGSQSLTLARAGGEELPATLDSSWSQHSLAAYAPWGWHSGLTLEFPSASQPLDLRIDTVRIERGRSFPPLRVLLAVIGAGLLFMATCGASGLSARVSTILAGLLLVGEITFLIMEPVLTVPFVPILLAATVAGLAVASFASGGLGVLARRGSIPALAPAAIAAAAAGLIAWLTATLFPLYEGGHFVFHSSIAEEIWQGRFLTYYFPSPENMLGRQKQWGNLIIPHSCLYHTVVSPLATFPRGWFYALEKTVLASLLASIALAASILATRFGSARAGAFTAIVAVSLPPTFQLLGLGHLMTLFGCWAATVALTFIALRFEKLEERATWWWATVLLTICFLSYTASLLFAVTVLGLAVPILYHRSPGPVRALAGAALAAAAAAFFLYYVNWTLPFLNDSLPQILSGAESKAEAPGLWNRLVTLPGRLSFTYGSPVLPLIGLAGLGLAAKSHHRTLLLLWASILILFSGLDLFFNFLLKHHYFVLTPVSVGVGLAADWLSKKGRLGRALVGLFLVYFLVMGGRAALTVALGQT